MRIWDIHPGYLNDQSLLGEHRELHGIVSIIKNRKLGYSRHPETLRWKTCGWALRQRHALLCAEMALRGFNEKTRVHLRARPHCWPETYLDLPCAQYLLLAAKYRDKRPGRIPLPKNAQELWAQHKYSVMARDPKRYAWIGRKVAGLRKSADWCALADELVSTLRKPPARGNLCNAIEHMWGYVSPYTQGTGIDTRKPCSLLRYTQLLAHRHNVTYLLSSTALSELAAWL